MSSLWTRAVKPARERLRSFPHRGPGGSRRLRGASRFSHAWRLDPSSSGCHLQPAHYYLAGCLALPVRTYHLLLPHYPARAQLVFGPAMVGAQVYFLSVGMPQAILSSACSYRWFHYYYHDNHHHHHYYHYYYCYYPRLRGGPRAGRCDGRKLAHGAPSELQLPLVPRGPGVEVLHVQRSHPPGKYCDYLLHLYILSLTATAARAASSDDHPLGLSRAPLGRCRPCRALAMVPPSQPRARSRVAAPPIRVSRSASH